MPLELSKIDKKKINFFHFKQLDEGDYLLTNDVGDHCLLESVDFSAFITGKHNQISSAKYLELKDRSFIRGKIDFDSMSKKYANKNMFLSQDAGLHIIVVTLRCDHRCFYCQASARPIASKSLDMDIPTAQKVVDRIFECKSKCITLEFQGGEPLLNFKTIEFIVDYAQKKNKTIGKDLRFTVVSNLTFMNTGIIKFLIKNNVNICSSLDGPEFIHNKHRVSLKNNNTHKNTVKWLKILKREYKKINFKADALPTVTRYSLPYYKEIINEYLKLGMRSIHLRPVTPFGVSAATWNKISFSVEDFLEFYRQALDYIIELNKDGIKFNERFALIFLTKIFTDKDPGFLDIRSPCGAGIGQLAYNFNGDVYTCDEGRMLSRLGDESFKLGNVNHDSYQEIMGNEVVKTMCIASCLDALPGCAQCVYKAYCGVCPIANHKKNGNIFNKDSFLCKIHMGILDYLFSKIKENKVKNIFDSWVRAK